AASAPTVAIPSRPIVSVRSAASRSPSPSRGVSVATGSGARKSCRWVAGTISPRRAATSAAKRVGATPIRTGSSAPARAPPTPPGAPPPVNPDHPADGEEGLPRPLRLERRADPLEPLELLLPDVLGRDPPLIGIRREDGLRHCDAGDIHTNTCSYKRR